MIQSTIERTITQPGTFTPVYAETWQRPVAWEPAGNGIVTPVMEQKPEAIALERTNRDESVNLTAVELAAHGLTRTQSAKAMFLSLRTVGRHLQAAQEGFGAKNIQNTVHCATIGNVIEPYKPKKKLMEPLRPAEIQELWLVALGYTAEQAAATRDVDYETSSTHRRNLRKKLGANTLANTVWIGHGYEYLDLSTMPTSFYPITPNKRNRRSKTRFNETVDALQTVVQAA